MSSPARNITAAEISLPEVTLRRDYEHVCVQACDYLPLMVPARPPRLIPDSALARLGLLAGCASAWLVVAIELVHAAR